MAANPEQKRRQQAALRRAWQLVKAEHPDLAADAYRRARAEVDNTAIEEGGQ